MVGPASALGGVLVALGAVDVLFNAANLGGLLAARRRVLDACFFSLAAHRLLPARGANGDLLARQLLAEVAVD